MSALTGAGIEGLRAELGLLLLGGEVEWGSPGLANERQLDAARRAHGAIVEARHLLRAGETCDLPAEELTAAAAALGEITGESVSEEVIARIFARFCVGK